MGNLVRQNRGVQFDRIVLLRHFNR